MYLVTVAGLFSEAGMADNFHFVAKTEISRCQFEENLGAVIEGLYLRVMNDGKNGSLLSICHSVTKI